MEKLWFIIADFENGSEIVDETDDYSDARYLQAEYATAFRGTIIQAPTQKPSKKLLADWYEA